MGTDFQRTDPVGFLRHVAVPVVGPLAGLHGQAVDVRHGVGTAGRGAGSRRADRADSGRNHEQRRNTVDAAHHATVAAPAAVPATAAPSGAKRPPVVIETDVMRATIDPDGAVLDASRTAQAENRARLDRERAAGARYRQEGRSGSPGRAARGQSAARVCRAVRRRRTRTRRCRTIERRSRSSMGPGSSRTARMPSM